MISEDHHRLHDSPNLHCPIVVFIGGGGGIMIFHPSDFEMSIPVLASHIDQYLLLVRPQQGPPGARVVFCTALIIFFTRSGFCLMTSFILGITDLNIELVRWNIIAEPPSIMISLTSGATFTLDLYFTYSSSKTPS